MASSIFLQLHFQLDAFLSSHLEVPDVGVGEERVLFVGVEEGEVLHDDGDEQVEHDVRDDDVEGAEVHDGHHEVAAVRLPEGGVGIPVEGGSNAVETMQGCCSGKDKVEINL